MNPRPAVTDRTRTPSSGRKVPGYFALTFAISWSGALVVVAPHLLHGQPVPKLAGILMFPVMLLGPVFSGVLFSAIDGAGVRALFRRITLPFPPRWLTVLLVPPALIAAVLGILTLMISRVYAPNNFVLGLSFGIAAGFLEEIGWTGYAFPAMKQRQNAFRASILLGILWSLWHLPVIDYLGTATPHGSAWTAYFLAFAAAMTAMRVIICWVYANTGSLLLAQLLHTVSTGSLVVLSPPRVGATQEAGWYLAYAAAVWLLVLFLLRTFGVDLRPNPTPSQ